MSFLKNVSVRTNILSEDATFYESQFPAASQRITQIAPKRYRMLTPTEQKAMDWICTGRTKENEQPVQPIREPGFALTLVDCYVQLRNCLLGGDVAAYEQIDNRFVVSVPGGCSGVKTGFVRSYSGKRPGKPVINFVFPEIAQNSADICYHKGLTINLLFAKGGRDMAISVPKGWEPWTEQSDKPTRKWAVYHGIVKDVREYPDVVEGIQSWKKVWNIR